MKYWNKSRKYRESWTIIEVDYDHHNSNWEYLKRWCQNHPSRGKFYSGTYTRKTWYFEDRGDAVIFTIMNLIGKNNG